MKINCLSPYFINYSAQGLDYLEIDLWIYYGERFSQVTPSYSLKTYAVNNAVSIEISSLVKDAFEFNPSGIEGGSIWVDYTLSENGGAVQPKVSLAGFYGYGYFEDGSNPQLDKAVLMSNSYVVKQGDGTVVIPVDSSYAPTVTFMKGSEVLLSTLVNDYPVNEEETELYISYIGTGIGRTISYSDRVINDGGTAEDSRCLDSFLSCTGLEASDKILVETASGVQVIRIEQGSQELYEPVNLTFINKFGAYQNITFFGKSTTSYESSEETYNKNLVAQGVYNTEAHSRRRLSSTAKESLILNSGFYKEDYNEVFRELIESEFVWLVEDGEYKPLVVDRKSIEFKTQINDKLISYEIRFSYANNKINNLR